MTLGAAADGALCDLANFGSLDIMVGEPSTMCRRKRDEVISSGMTSIIYGTLTTRLLARSLGCRVSRPNSQPAGLFALSAHLAETWSALLASQSFRG